MIPLSAYLQELTQLSLWFPDSVDLPEKGPGTGWSRSLILGSVNGDLTRSDTCWEQLGPTEGMSMLVLSHFQVWG